MASPQTIQPAGADTMLEEGNPTANVGTNTALQVQGISSSRMRAALNFDFSAVVPAGATITLATLSLYAYLENAGETITCYRLLRTGWVDSQATWNIYKTGSSWTTAGALSDGNDFTSTNAATSASLG